MPDIHPVDLLATIVVGVACVRGLLRGMIREVFSVLALGAAVVAVLVWNDALAEALYPLVRGQISSTTLRWLSGALLGVVVVIAVGLFGAVMGRGARAVGLGWADRAGGAVLGVAEGALVVGVLLVLAGGLLGRNSAPLVRSQSLAWLERVEAFADGAPLEIPTPGDVAAPGPESD